MENPSCGCKLTRVRSQVWAAKSGRVAAATVLLDSGDHRTAVKLHGLCHQHGTCPDRPDGYTPVRHGLQLR